MLAIENDFECLNTRIYDRCTRRRKGWVAISLFYVLCLHTPALGNNVCNLNGTDGQSFRAS